MFYLLIIFTRYLLEPEVGPHLSVIKKIYVHPEYDDHLFTNNIALIKLNFEVELGELLQTVCLPKGYEGNLPIPKKYGVAPCWQRLSGAKVSTIQSDGKCSNSSLTLFNSSMSFCAKDKKTANDTWCNRGGSFVQKVRREDGYRWVATGIENFGKRNARKGRFSFYTKLYPFINWIRATMKRE